MLKQFKKKEKGNEWTLKLLQFEQELRMNGSLCGISRWKTVKNTSEVNRLIKLVARVDS